jgi:hypothetical protein
LYYSDFVDSNGIKIIRLTLNSYLLCFYHGLERKDEEEKVTGETKSFWSGIPG